MSDSRRRVEHKRSEGRLGRILIFVRRPSGKRLKWSPRYNLSSGWKIFHKRKSSKLEYVQIFIICVFKVDTVCHCISTVDPPYSWPTKAQHGSLFCQLKEQRILYWNISNLSYYIQPPESPHCPSPILTYHIDKERYIPFTRKAAEVNSSWDQCRHFS